MTAFPHLHRHLVTLLMILAPAAGTAGDVAGDQWVYRDVIAPIFEQKCTSCHGAEKQKGKFRMDEYDLLVKGGKEGEGIVHGNAKDSAIVIRIGLPEGDDEHMPPEEKMQLEPHEILLIKWWIDGGASKDAKIDDLKPGDDIKAALAKLEPAGEWESKKADAGRAAKESAGKRDAIKGEVERLSKEFPGALNFESRADAGLVFTGVSMRGKFADADLAKLGTVMPSMVSLDLSSSIITDKGAALLKTAVELRVLRLSETAITDAGVGVLAGLPKLESLNIYGTKVTNAGILKLAGLTHLRRLYVWQTKVDANGVKELQARLPGCKIVTGW